MEPTIIEYITKSINTLVGVEGYRVDVMTAIATITQMSGDEVVEMLADYERKLQ